MPPPEAPLPALTHALIADAFPKPVEDDRGTMALRPQAEIDASLAASLAALPPGAPVWIFAYGSLMWAPGDLPVAERQPATLHGWHRSFCLWQWRYRGTRERPGLMLALDRGGSCRGLALRVDSTDLHSALAGVWRREIIGYGYEPRRVTVWSDAGPLPAFVFVVNRAGPRYAGRLPDEVAAGHIATACGHIGPAATYLLETLLACQRCGIADRYLWRLQALVAARLQASGAPR